MKQHSSEVLPIAVSVSTIQNRQIFEVMRSSTANALNVLRGIMASTLDGYIQGTWVVGPRSEICPEIKKDYLDFR